MREHIQSKSYRQISGQTCRPEALGRGVDSKGNDAVSEPRENWIVDGSCTHPGRNVCCQPVMSEGDGPPASTIHTSRVPSVLTTEFNISSRYTVPGVALSWLLLSAVLLLIPRVRTDPLRSRCWLGSRRTPTARRLIREFDERDPDVGGAYGGAKRHGTRHKETEAVRSPVSNVGHGAARPRQVYPKAGETLLIAVGWWCPQRYVRLYAGPSDAGPSGKRMGMFACWRAPATLLGPSQLTCA